MASSDCKICRFKITYLLLVDAKEASLKIDMQLFSQKATSHMFHCLTRFFEYASVIFPNASGQFLLDVVPLISENREIQGKIKFVFSHQILTF